MVAEGSGREQRYRKVEDENRKGTGMSPYSNILDINRVVQWKLPPNVSTFVQQAGRAARGAGCTGIAVLLVKRSVYEADLQKLAQATVGKSKGI